MRQRQAACAGDKAFRAVVAEAGLATAQSSDALDEVVERFPGLAGVDRQGHQTLGHALRGRELAFAESPLLERGGVVQRRVMGAYFNAPLVEHRVDEIFLCPAEFPGVNLDGIKVEDMFATGRDRRERYSRHVAQAG